MTIRTQHRKTLVGFRIPLHLFQEFMADIFYFVVLKLSVTLLRIYGHDHYFSQKLASKSCEHISSPSISQYWNEFQNKACNEVLVIYHNTIFGTLFLVHALCKSLTQKIKSLHISNLGPHICVLCSNRARTNHVNIELDTNLG